MIELYRPSDMPMRDCVAVASSAFVPVAAFDHRAPVPTAARPVAAPKRSCLSSQSATSVWPSPIAQRCEARAGMYHRQCRQDGAHAARADTEVCGAPWGIRSGNPACRARAFDMHSEFHYSETFLPGRCCTVSRMTSPCSDRACVICKAGLFLSEDLKQLKGWLK